MNSQNPNPFSKGQTWHRTATVPVEVTLYHWNHTDLDRSGKQFSTAPAIRVRFRCVGAPSAAQPRRFKVELARALDRLPELDRSQLSELCGVLALAIGEALGLEIAPIPLDVIDLGTFDKY